MRGVRTTFSNYVKIFASTGASKKNLLYFYDIINILIVAYSLDYTVFNF